ncbi:hypothetical protein AAFF_G00243850 [Aldrovandia affinis]|uniref:Uncharacterized protein n=1 Tax=Aldrovandia affinis TaxID=143900 RepID=A0AAD7W495_9TELE|nr:hypothetical protein AAFF_G00243850 [Aldrovandia affinis]
MHQYPVAACPYLPRHPFGSRVERPIVQSRQPVLFRRRRPGQEAQVSRTLAIRMRLRVERAGGRAGGERARASLAFSVPDARLQ